MVVKGFGDRRMDGVEMILFTSVEIQILVTYPPLPTIVFGE